CWVLVIDSSPSLPASPWAAGEALGAAEAPFCPPWSRRATSRFCSARRSWTHAVNASSVLNVGTVFLGVAAGWAPSSVPLPVGGALGRAQAARRTRTARAARRFIPVDTAVGGPAIYASGPPGFLDGTSARTRSARCPRSMISRRLLVSARNAD